MSVGVPPLPLRNRCKRADQFLSFMAKSRTGVSWKLRRLQMQALPEGKMTVFLLEPPTARVTGRTSTPQGMLV